MKKFDIIITCQGQSTHHYVTTLLGALIVYSFHYLTKKHYGTMNFMLREVEPWN